MDIIKNRKEWIDALRSDDFIPAFHRLKRIGMAGTYHCPWGIACEIYHKHNISSSSWTEREQGVQNFMIENDFNEDNDSYPPSEVLEFFGSYGDEMSDIMGMNDEDEKPFGEIADFIEEDRYRNDYNKVRSK